MILPEKKTKKIKPPTKEEVEKYIHPPKKKQTRKKRDRDLVQPVSTDISKRFAVNVLALAKYQNITVSHMEHECGLGTGYLAQYRSGQFKRGIPLDIAWKLAEKVGKDLIDLCTNDYHNIRWKARYDREMNDVEQMKRELADLQW
jgi:hypothetical protein